MTTATASKGVAIGSWVLQIALGGAMIVMGALPKLTGQFPSPQLFETLGVEPIGRYGVGVWELAAGVLILIPRTAVYGAVLVVLAMAGAFASHVGPLGLFPEFTDAETGEVVSLPFFMSLVFLALGAVVVFLRRDRLRIGGGGGASGVG